MNTFADSIEIVDTEMTNVTGSVLSLDKETDDLDIYNVENFAIRDYRDPGQSLQGHTGRGRDRLPGRHG